jgi:hypothetical protein
MDLRYRSWRLSIKYFLNLAWIDCNTFSGDDMSQKWNLLKLECTLAELGIKLMVMKSLQNNLKMLFMLFFILGVDQDVINEYHDKLVQLRHDYGVHQIHEMCRSIDESIQHNQILIQPVPSRECSLRNIFWMDLDLMITRPKINLREDLSTSKLIKENVDAGQKIFVLNGDGIQRPVIDTQPQRLILLLHKQRWTTQGEELRRMKPLSINSFNCTFNSANSLGVILYGHLEMGVMPCCSSMVNSTSQYGGMPGKSSRKTSGYSRAIGISSRLGAARW